VTVQARALAGFSRVLHLAGKVRTYRKLGAPGGYDPATGTLTAPTAQTIALRLVLMSGEQTQTPDGMDRFARIALLPASYGNPPQPLDPQDGDQILDGTRVFTVGDLAPHEIAGITVGHRATLRAGR
jgi:hypothetical protein